MLRVASAIGGVQAQLSSAAQIALATRVEGLTPVTVEAAIVRRRSLARAWCMRSTVHLVPARELARFVRGSAGRFDRERGWVLRKGVAPAALDRALAAVAGSLDRPMGRTELAQEVARRLGVGLTLRRGAGWATTQEVPWLPVDGLSLPIGYLIQLAHGQVVLCAGPPCEEGTTMVRADAWVRPWKELDRPTAEDELLRTYLATHGPARVTDFAWWVGARVRDATKVWARAEDELVEVDVEGRRGSLLRQDLAALQERRPPVEGVRLLPFFDVLMLGHPTREHLFGAAEYRHVYRPQGWIAPVVLAGGRPAGVWSHRKTGPVLRVAVRPFRTLTPDEHSGIREEAERLAGFLGAGSARLSFGR
jgi:hypothetical protein